MSNSHISALKIVDKSLKTSTKCIHVNFLSVWTNSVTVPDITGEETLVKTVSVKLKSKTNCHCGLDRNLVKSVE